MFELRLQTSVVASLFQNLRMECGRGLHGGRLTAWKNGSMTSRETHFGTCWHRQIKSPGPVATLQATFRHRFTSATLTSTRTAMLEISPQKWLVRFVRICVGSLSAMGDKNRLPGVNVLHDAGTGEEEMIDAELIGDLVFFPSIAFSFKLWTSSTKICPTLGLWSVHWHFRLLHIVSFTCYPAGKMKR